MKDKIIIIGGGCSGLSSALLKATLKELKLSDKFEVVENADNIVANLGEYERKIRTTINCT